MLSLLACALLVAQDPLADPASGWEGFGLGSWVRMKSTTRTKAGGEEVVLEATVKTTLVSSSAEKLVLEVESRVDENIRRERRDLPKKPAPRPELRVLSRGEAELTVGERRIKCAWVKYQVEQEKDGVPTRAETTLWTHASVPGRVVKIVVDLKQPLMMKTELLVQAFELK